MSGDVVVVERVVKAPAETVFTFFTDPVQWLRWQGIDATIEPHAGGAFRVNVRGDGYASGRILELDPPRRIVFSWGWEMDGNPMPPGSTLVEVDLLPDPAGTLVRLTHRNLPPGTAAMHDEGWNHYLDRLATAAAGGDAGPDPWLAV
jgi:uncharacterized protein YndB with AHSA1/START domain